MEKQVKTEVSYKKGKVYQHTNNNDYIVTKEYEPETILKRELNPNTETYEYIKETKNDKLDWENQIQMINQTELLKKESETK